MKASSATKFSYKPGLLDFNLTVQTKPSLVIEKQGYCLHLNYWGDPAIIILIDNQVMLNANDYLEEIYNIVTDFDSDIAELLLKCHTLQFIIVFLSTKSCVII